MNRSRKLEDRIDTFLRKRKSKFLSRYNNFWGWLLITPVVLGLSLWVVFPLGLSFAASFCRWDMITEPVFIGFGNYIDMFRTDPLFLNSVWITLYFTIAGVSIQIIVALFAALLLNTKIKGMRLFRTLYYFPSMVPIVVASALWMWLYNPQFGLFNLILINIGIPPQQWVYGIRTVIPSLIIMSTWSIGNIIIIFLAGLQDIPKELMEAVDIDGGNALHKFLYVILPLMSPVIFYNIVMGIINGFQTFTQGYIMTNGGPANSSLFYVLHLYRQAFMFSNMGYACAMAWFLFVVTGIVTALVFRTSTAWVFYQGGRKG